MTAVGDDWFAPGDRAPVSIHDALACILPRLPSTVDSEQVPIGAAVSRVLVEELASAVDVPGANNSAVDGYAVHFDDLHPSEETRLTIIGRAAAGHAFPGAVPRGTALRIFTGALMPDGPDTVVMQEDCRRDDEAIVVAPGLRRGSNRRKAGEDVRAGATALPPRIRLRPQDVGLAAAVGCTHLRVARPLRLCVVGAARSAAARPGQSGPGLSAFLRQLGAAVSEMSLAPRNPAALAAALADAAANHDVLVAAGRFSSGETGDVGAAIRSLGVIHLWHLATEPGCSIALGQLRHGDRRSVFVGLPEDAMTAIIGFLFVVRPILMRLMGRRDVVLHSYRLRAGFARLKDSPLPEFLPARLERSAAGESIAIACSRGSILSADGVIELPETLPRVEPGVMVEYFPFGEVGG